MVPAVWVTLTFLAITVAADQGAEPESAARIARAAGDPGCTTKCRVAAGKVYDPLEEFELQSGCNLFKCTCRCDGSWRCPQQRAINTCTGVSGAGGSGGRRGSSGSSGGRGSSGSSGSSGGAGTGVSTCTECTHRGVSYPSLQKFEFEKGCFRYHCSCRCNGSYDCNSKDSEYICAGQRRCNKCDAGDGVLKDPESNFQLKQGCVLYKRCRCNCDGGWSCEEGEYTCDVCRGCKIDGNTYPGNSTFELIRGCDLFKRCECECNGSYKCHGERDGDVEDLCGKCRKCKIGESFYDGETTFAAQVGCTRYSRCACECDGTYTCTGGSFTCAARGDQPVEGGCTDCVHGSRRYRPGQSFDYVDGCRKYRGCECKCGKTHCRDVDDTCGDCRTCLVNGTEYRGGTRFTYKRGCIFYNNCDCHCNGAWECYGTDAVDTCNSCKTCKMTSSGQTYEAFSRFSYTQDCYQYQCFCGCDGATRCPGETVINTCRTPESCGRCDVNGKEIRGNTQFTYEYDGMFMSCRCNCDGAYVCMGEWLYVRKDISISGSGIGSGGGSCFNCFINGQNYRGDTTFPLVKSGINLNCTCYCNGGYYCYGFHTYGDGCQTCQVSGRYIKGDTAFSAVYAGFKLSCTCSCDGSYICLGGGGTTVLQCLTAGQGSCFPRTCSQCIVDGVRFNGGDQFGTIYEGVQLTCDCGCDGSYYCEGGGIVISCVNGRCTQIGGCSSCSVYGQQIEGDTNFELIYKGLKMGCKCECGGNYQCLGSSGERIISCISNGAGCLTGQCGACVVNNRQYAGRSTFRYIYQGFDMMCSCACDGSYYCKGIRELIEISCIGGTCTRIGCGTCSVYGQTFTGESSFSIIYSGVKLDCKCSCDSSYICMGSTGTEVVRCINGFGCLPSRCGSCLVNGREFAGRSTYRSVYKGIDVLCTCGCDSSSFCKGITTSIEVVCIGGTCTRVGCKECYLWGKEFLGSSQFDIIYQGVKLGCECDCDGGYVCSGSTGVVIRCLDGTGQGCLLTQCSTCMAGGRVIPGRSTFRYVYNGIQMDCTCACDSSYFCVGVSERIEITCIGGTCTPIGCETCDLYGKQIAGASKFELVYNGVLLDCRCNCDGGYVCVGSTGTTLIQCRNGRGTCLPSACTSTCTLNGQTFGGGSEFRSEYNGIDMICRCGCDTSIYCIGVSQDIKISCLGGRCTPLGCADCRIFGQSHQALSQFDIVYSGLLMRCTCHCSGGYVCTGTGVTDITCRDNRGCLPQICNSCSFQGRSYSGRDIFKHVYSGIDMSCTCGCDGSVHCVGVIQDIRLKCINGVCEPFGCQPCRAFGRTFTTLAKFDAIYRGIKMSCDCSCDGGYFCIGYDGGREIDCKTDGTGTCLPPTCRSCFHNNREVRAGSTYPYVFEGIDMTCTCACDGSAFCKGVREIIEVSCYGGTCRPLNCRTCSIFGQEHPTLSSFDIIYQGVRLQCTCGCDSSYVCIGSGGVTVIDCRSGLNCLPTVCKQCVLGDGRPHIAGSQFPYVYKGIDMTCTCGCDGSVFCTGVQEFIEISCIGGRCSPRNCKTCSIFGQEFQPITKFDIIYQGTQLDCLCSCDSSYVCKGKSGKDILTCKAGEVCLESRCKQCVVESRRYESFSAFAYTYKNIATTCKCGCDGTAYCVGVTEEIYLSCINGRCYPIGCQGCNLFGRDYQGDSSFDLIYKGSKMDCDCHCDSGFTCVGHTDSSVTLECKPGQACVPRRCRQCRPNRNRYDGGSTFQLEYRGSQMTCLCGCDGSYYCEGVDDHRLSCIRRGRCTETGGCRPCSLFGQSIKGGEDRSFVYQGYNMTCACSCDTSFRCIGVKGDVVVDCKPGQRSCLPTRCRSCRIGRKTVPGNSAFSRQYNGYTLTCVCGCDGTSYCRAEGDREYTCPKRGRCTQVGCRNCVSDGQERNVDAKFYKTYDGIRMRCSCSCDGSYQCQGVTTSIKIVCTGEVCSLVGCRSCIVNGREHAYGSQYETVTAGRKQSCRCECDGSSTCKAIEPTCKSCTIEGDVYEGLERKRVYKGTQSFICTCYCTGKSECIPERPRCNICTIAGREFTGNTQFPVVLESELMQCSCDCRGVWECKGKTKTCTPSGCIDICRQCSIAGKSYLGTSTNIAAVISGFSMKCNCDCTGGYECTGEYRRCTQDGCTDLCQQCVIAGQSYSGRRKNFDVSYDGIKMECSCDCNGGYNCIGEYRKCTPTGCVDTCRQCVIGGKSYPGTSRDFTTRIGGTRMDCDCDCDGGFVCTGGYKRCTPSGCVSTCRQCTIAGRSYAGTSRGITVRLEGTRMDCNCDCDGGFVCIGGSKRCTPSGCVDTCKQCVLGGRSYAGTSRNLDVYLESTRMQCDCDCDGGFVCNGENKRCTPDGCVSTCRQCLISGRQYPGTSRDVAVVIDGIRMECDCDCNGGFVCIGGNRRCTQDGCASTCRECTIGGRSYPGTSRGLAVLLEGTRMDCTCDCDGGFVCIGENKRCTPSGCVDTCSQCSIGGRSYPGTSRGLAVVLEGTRMDCTCDCDGGFVCIGENKRCTPSGCVDTCSKCVIAGRSYAGTSRGLAVFLEGTRMDCDCDCDGGFVCIGENKRCTPAGCVDTCRQCVIAGRSFPGTSRDLAVTISGTRMKCNCDCDGGFVCVGGYKRCTQDGCVDTCRQCVIGGRSYAGTSRGLSVVLEGTRMECNCDCDGGFACIGKYKRCTQDGCVDTCRPCVIGGRSYAGTSRGLAVFLEGTRMDCDCDCDGDFVCVGENKRCTQDGCVNTCRQCVIGGRSYPGTSRSLAVLLEGSRMDCDCDCDGGFICTGEYKRCTPSGCVDTCQQCVIAGRSYAGTSRDIAVSIDGTRMDCDCNCDGSFVCVGEYRRCTQDGCVSTCSECVIGGRSYPGTSSGLAVILEGTRMDCDCDCDGGFVCVGENKRCTPSGCIDTCQQCVIAGRSYPGTSQGLAVFIDGIRMECDCDCNGGFQCIGEYRRCSPSGCVDTCRQCTIGGRSYPGTSKDLSVLLGGVRMECDCDCDGGFVCVGEYRRCTQSGCVDTCRQCVIGGRAYPGTTRNRAVILDGTRMECDCDCTGGFVCVGENRRCTASGCIDTCKQCVVGGRSYPGTSKDLVVMLDGTRMECDCDCTGGFVCVGEYRRCTPSGCVDTCRQCVIGGRAYPGTTRSISVILEGVRMECTCDCTGGFECVGEYKRCTSSGCVDTCRQCVIGGRSYPGTSRNLVVLLDGNRMECTCDCTGGFECVGEYRRCTAAGCVDTCPGCVIEGVTYTGNTVFDIFHNQYGIDMSCECSCGGSYTCKGKVTTCEGRGCNPGECRDCNVKGVTHRGNSKFETNIDGLRMSCTCFCTGGYKCVGKTSSCTGYGCTQNDAACENCIIGGKEYKGNSRFTLRQDGIQMNCRCRCDRSFTCRGEKTTKEVCIGTACENTDCLPCNAFGRLIPGNSQFEAVESGVTRSCYCDCYGKHRCEGTRYPCRGQDCSTTGCKRCVIDRVPYSGNTQFTIRSGDIVMNCSCYCDGSYSCKGSTGIETTCVGAECADHKCKNCLLDGREYKLDEKFRMQKNRLTMNCVCECDGAYRCFSVTGTCVGRECDEYGCSYCMIDGQRYKGNSDIEVRPGLYCTCECSGHYECRTSSLKVTCQGADCGVGGCSSCLVDDMKLAGNSRFQITHYGLFMQCACNCDSTYTCRGYQIISDGSGPVETRCRPCVIGDRRFNGNTRFQAIVNGVRSLCACNCNGEYSCAGSVSQDCRACVIGQRSYPSNREFTLYRNGNNIRCMCNCYGDFVCEGRRPNSCVGENCVHDGCKECDIFGHRYKGDTKFTTDAGGVMMLCECFCNGDYHCKGHKEVTNVILPSSPKSTCLPCFVSRTEKYAANSEFSLRRGCFEMDCVCSCEGIWECKKQLPRYVCAGSGYDSGIVTQARYSIAGSHVYTTDTAESSRSTVISKPDSTYYGSRDCVQCVINEKAYEGNTPFLLKDGCLRFTCSCDCTGVWNCTSVVASNCGAPDNTDSDILKLGKVIATGSGGSSQTSVTRTEQTIVAIRPAGSGSSSKFSTIDTGPGYSSRQIYSSETSSGTGSSLPITPNTGTSTSHTFTSGSSSTGSRSHGSSSHRTETSRTVTQTSSSSSSGSTCLDCTVGNQTVKANRDFSYRSGCTEFSCECFCNGTHVCPPERSTNICEKDKKAAAASEREKTGCKVGGRTYKQKLFSYTKDCIKHVCRCYNNGSYFCDRNKARRVC